MAEGRDIVMTSRGAGAMVMEAAAVAVPPDVSVAMMPKE
jgi:hypothetical protein